VTAKCVAVALSAVFVVYAALVGWRGVLLIAHGGVVPVLLGLAVVVLPLLGLYVVWRELRFGLATQTLARELEAAGELPVDDLPRRPSGRPERAAADAAFEHRKAAVEADPDDWKAWFALATAYDAAGDRRRAREAMRTAIQHHG